MYLTWLKIVVTLVLVLMPVWIGSRLGVRFKKTVSGEVDHTPLGSVVAAALGLLAFMLAFTFQMAADRYASRKELLMDEVTIMRATYLKAGLLDETYSVPIRKLIREYVDLRIYIVSDSGSVETAIARSREIQLKLWENAKILAAEDPSSQIYALYISSLNELIEMHNRRMVVALQYRIPQIVLWSLYFIAFFSMLILGYQFGVAGRANVLVVLLLALNFSAVMWLIFVLDDPMLGIIRVNHQQVYDLKEEISVSQ